VLTGLDAVVIERLVTGGILAAVAIAVAFGPEFRQALARLRNRTEPDRRSIGVEPRVS
jgi:hypothetical protein